MLTIVGDIHCKSDNLEKVANLFDDIEEQGNDVVLLGDVLDTKELVRSKCLNLIYTKLLKSKLKWTILVGNHDFHDISCTTHSLEPLKSLPNVTIVDKPLYDKERFWLYLPYYHDLNEFKKAISSHATNIIFMHQGVNGFDYGNGYKETNGISEDELKKLRVGSCISGHFHAHQEGKKVTYVGTPFTQSFGETNTNKYVAILDEGRNGTATEPVIDLSLKFIETSYPKHMTVTINAEAPASKGYSLASTIGGLLEMMTDESNYNRVILNGSKENVKNYANIIKQLRPMYKVVEMPNVSISAKIDERIDNLAKFETWAKDIKKLDNNLIRKGMEILRGI